MLNLKDKMPLDIDKFYITHDSFNQNYKNLMLKIAQFNKEAKCEFIDFSKEVFLKKLGNLAKAQGGGGLERNSFLNRWTHLAFARFEALKFLEECENILYLDFDVLLLKSVKELFKLKNKHFALAAYKGKTPLNHIFYQNKLQNATVWMLPVLLLNDNLKNPLVFYKFIYKNLARRAEFIDDQALFSLYVLENKIKIKNLDKNKYVGQVCLKTSLNSSIIHAYGSTQRFWNNALCKHTW